MDGANAARPEAVTHRGGAGSYLRARRCGCLCLVRFFSSWHAEVATWEHTRRLRTTVVALSREPATALRDPLQRLGSFHIEDLTVPAFASLFHLYQRDTSM